MLLLLLLNRMVRFCWCSVCFMLISWGCGSLLVVKWSWVKVSCRCWFVNCRRRWVLLFVWFVILLVISGRFLVVGFIFMSGGCCIFRVCCWFIIIFSCVGVFLQKCWFLILFWLIFFCCMFLLFSVLFFLFVDLFVVLLLFLVMMSG